MRCESVLLRLDELRTGELDPCDVAAVERHLSLCPPCAEARDAILQLAERAPALCGECPTSALERIRDRWMDRWDVLEVGELRVWTAFSESGLTLLLPSRERCFEDFRHGHERRYGKDLRRGRLPSELAEQIRAAIRGQASVHPTVDLSGVGEFERRVLEALMSIPRGEVRPYAWVAREVGKPTAVRAVGNTCAHNPVPFVVPCHRVVPSTGGTGSYAFGADVKRRLLNREGVAVDWLAELHDRGARYVTVAGADWYCYPTCGDTSRIAHSDLLLLRDENEAAERGLEPCDTCRPPSRLAA